MQVLQEKTGRGWRGEGQMGGEEEKNKREIYYDTVRLTASVTGIVAACYHVSTQKPLFPGASQGS